MKKEVLNPPLPLAKQNHTQLKKKKKKTEKEEEKEDTVEIKNVVIQVKK